jgi:hypothetical protein
LRIRLHGWSLFTAVKYLTYALLLLNVYLFLVDELGSLEYTFSGAMTVAEFMQGFAATIDTGAWVILLLLFELETSILDDAKIHGALKLFLHGIRGLCYVAIVYAFSGYCSELITLYQTTPMPAAWDPCEGLTRPWFLLLGLDEYAPITAQNCAGVGAHAMRLDGYSIVALPEVLRPVRWLAWTDVINAGAWILVVVVLEIEVRLQLRGRLTDHWMRSTVFVKYAIYATLFAAAVYWWFEGTFLDFWDACLWLFAFIFIELNVFNWQQETQAEAEAVAVQAVRD